MFRFLATNPEVFFMTDSSEPSIGEQLRNILNGMGKTDQQMAATTTNQEDDNRIQTRRRKLKEKAQTADVPSYRNKQKEISRLLDEVRIKFEEVNNDDDEDDEDSD